MRKNMSYAEEQIYKDTKALQWCKEGFVCKLANVAEKLMVASTKEDITNILDALSLDIETVLDVLEKLERSKEYFSKKEANNE